MRRIPAAAALVAVLAAGTASADTFFRMNGNKPIGGTGAPAAGTNDPGPPPAETTTQPPQRGRLAASFSGFTGTPSVGDPASGAFTASGATAGAPVSYAVTSGALPTGISLGPDGRLAGTFSQAGSFAFAVTASDGGADDPGSASVSVDVRLAAPAIAVTEARPSTFAGTTYRAQARQTNDSGVTGWGVTAPWLSVDPAGAIVGVPPAGTPSGTYSVTGTDSYGRSATASQAFTLVEPSLSVSFPAMAYPGDPVQGRLSTNLEGAAFSIQGKPAWLNLAPDGTLSGIVGNDPVGAMTASATLEQANPTAAVPFALSPVTVATTGNYASLVGGQSVSGTATASNGSGWAYSLTGQPAWMAIDAATGALSGNAQNATATATGVVARATRNGVSVSSEPFAVAVTAATLDASTSAISVYEGAPVDFSATTTLQNPTWSVTSAPAAPWLVTTPNGQSLSSSSVTGDVGADTTYKVTLTASQGGASVSKVVNVTVKAVTVTVTYPGTRTIRPGRSFSVQAVVNNATGGTVSGSVAGMNNVSFSGTPASSTLSATEPDNQGTAYVYRDPIVTWTGPVATNGAPRATATGHASVPGLGDIKLAVAPHFRVNTPAQWPSQRWYGVTNQGIGYGPAAGTISWKLFRNGVDVTSTFPSLCPSVSVVTTNGSPYFTGSATSLCSVDNLRWYGADDGGAYPEAMAEDGYSNTFTLTVN